MVVDPVLGPIRRLHLFGYAPTKVKHGTEALVCLNQWVMDHFHEKEIRYIIFEPSIIILVSETKYFGMHSFHSFLLFVNLPSVWLPLSAVCSQENLEILEKKRIHLEKIAAASSQKILTCDTERHVRFFPEKMEQHEQHSKISSCMIVQNSLGWSFDCRFVCASLFSLYIYIYIFVHNWV